MYKSQKEKTYQEKKMIFRVWLYEEKTIAIFILSFVANGTQVFFSF
jgi:hypothetical protein